MTTVSNLPDAALAETLACKATGAHPTAIRRFPTGSQHFVFEATFADRDAVVVRIARITDRALVRGASRLSSMLRPLGVPLPAIIAEDTEAPFPYLILERLAGTDLGHVISSLPAHRLGPIAARIVEAQRIVAATPSAGRYGYAADPSTAPHARWSENLQQGLTRSRTRIATVGLFDLALVDALDVVFSRLRAEADAQPATPFLHDTTTKNVIVTEQGVFSGIVDVDDLCFGDPRSVVALTLAALTAFGGPIDYANAWMHLAGFRDDRLFRFYVAMCLLDFLSEQGQVFNGNQPPSSSEQRQRLLDLYAAALHHVTAQS
jgi:aminoglycoside phosphotransferase (APT) family kinase protein